MKFHKHSFAILLLFAVAANAAVFGTLSNLQKFPVYQTCDAAAVAGVPCPVYDASKPVKSWVDPNPPAADREGNVKYTSICLARDRRTPAVENGKPFLCEFTISADEARRLNIPPKDFTGRIQEPAQLFERPVPMRALLPDEEMYFGFGGLPMVRKADAQPAPESGGTASVDVARIEQLLITVLAKIEVLLATAGRQ